LQTMVNEAINSIRKAMLAAFVLVVVWVLALPTTTAELKVRHAAEQLSAWLILKNKFVDTYIDWPTAEAFHERFVSTNEDKQVIDSEMGDPPLDKVDLRGGGNTSPWPYELVLRTQWPGEKPDVRVHLQARPIEGPYEVWSVGTDARFLPFDTYDVVIDKSGCSQDCVKVLGREEWAVSRTVAEPRVIQFLLNRQNHPREWEDIAALLWPGVVELPEAAGLKQSDPVISTFVKDALRAQHNFWGVSVDAGLFLAAPGILLGAQAFMLLGPLLVLINRRDSMLSEPWIMTTATRVPRRRILEGILLLISAAWCLVPLGIWYAQAEQAIWLHPFERACYRVGLVGLAIASVVTAALLVELWRIRQEAGAALLGAGPEFRG
jgi:hypothetical protein